MTYHTVVDFTRSGTYGLCGLFRGCLERDPEDQQYLCKKEYDYRQNADNSTGDFIKRHGYGTADNATGKYGG